MEVERSQVKKRRRNPPLVFDPNTGRYSGLHLERGHVVHDAAGTVYSVDRANGFMLTLTTLKDGQRTPKDVSFSTDDSIRKGPWGFRELYSDGWNVFDRKKNPITKGRVARVDVRRDKMHPGKWYVQTAGNWTDGYDAVGVGKVTRQEAALEGDSIANGLIRRGEAAVVHIYVEGKKRASIGATGWDPSPRSNPVKGRPSRVIGYVTMKHFRGVPDDKKRHPIVAIHRHKNGQLSYETDYEYRPGVPQMIPMVMVEHFEEVSPNPRGRARRSNPTLMIVAGNPPRASVEKAWCRFHQRSSFTGKVRRLPEIPGGPSTVFALGWCHAIDFGEGDQTFSGSRPIVCCDPSDQSLWILASRSPMDLSGGKRRSLAALTYDPMRSSGKDSALYRHDFDAPRPRLSPIGSAKSCRAALLQGGVYTVTDWIYS